MSEAWRWLLRMTNARGDITLPEDQIAQWPETTVAGWIEQGLLEPNKSACRLICQGCGEIADADVVWLGDKAILSCAQCGPLQIDPARLRCWQINVQRLLDQIRHAMRLKGVESELADGRLWRLGNLHWSGVVWPVICGRGLGSARAGAWFENVRTTLQTVLISFSGLPSPEVSDRFSGTAFALDELVIDGDGPLVVDWAEINLRLPKPASVLGRKKDKLPKRASRIAHIESLTRELTEHVRSAREYAVDTQLRTGKALLLPRPTCELLAARLRVDKSTVSRCLADASARELRMVWELAVDLDRILGQ